MKKRDDEIRAVCVALGYDPAKVVNLSIETTTDGKKVVQVESYETRELTDAEIQTVRDALNELDP